MRLSQIFARRGELAPLIEEACAVDEPAHFKSLVARMPPHPRQELFRRAVRECARAFAERAGVADETQAEDAAARVCFGGQQPYVDYYPAVLAKLDALEDFPGACVYAFADYAPLGSDPWMARTLMPSAAAPDGLLPLNFQRPARPHRGKDLRFVPPPAPATLAAVAEKLKGAITHAAKFLPAEAFSKRAAFERLRLLLADYEEARRRGASAGEFNSYWSARAFRRLGFAAPLVSLSELLARDDLLPAVAETLSVFIRQNDLFDESVTEALSFDAGGDLNFGDKGAGHVPVALADPQSGVRRTLRLARRGADHLLSSTKGTEEVFNVGRADADALCELLRRLRGRWSLDVFTPVFLFRLGVGGIVNGRGSIRYSLVLGHVMRRLFGERHAPNLLCSCSPPPAGAFVTAAARAHGGRLPPALRRYEPTLVARLLTSGPETIRAEVAACWRDAETP